MDSKTDNKAASAAKTEWVAKVTFDAELHKEDRHFDAGADIPGNVSQTTLDLWEERGLIKKA